MKIQPQAVNPVAGTPLAKAMQANSTYRHKGADFTHYSVLSKEETALDRMNTNQKLSLIGVLILLVAGLAVNWHTTFIVVTALLTLLYFGDLLFNLFLIWRSFARAPEVIVSPDELAARTHWPTYTIFCPLYREWEVLPQFVTAMTKLDYPKDQLKVLLLLEEDDAETIEKAQAYDLPPYFDIVIVPHGMPKTKPKALNYALGAVSTDFCVIYDAEDVPDPDQLKKAVVAFDKSSPKTICIQAKLNFYNPHQNVLTRVFTAEYSLWFDLVLTGLQTIDAPIPLGGTSNHFKTTRLKAIKGWDAFNVTEDCDLGMRLAKEGFRTAIVDSTTLEEANSDVHNWIRQRSRWIKGYIQTYFVHMRRPGAFMQSGQRSHLAIFQFVVGGKVMSMFINPFMWAVTISYFVLRPTLGPFIESFYPAPVLYMAVFSVIFGNFLYLYYYMIGCAKRGYDDIIKYVFLVPLYWVAMSYAAWLAAIEIVRKPHYWAKTNHGLHLKNQKTIDQASVNLGRQLVDSPDARRRPITPIPNVPSLGGRGMAVTFGEMIGPQAAQPAIASVTPRTTPATSPSKPVSLPVDRPWVDGLTWRQA